MLGKWSHIFTFHLLNKRIIFFRSTIEYLLNHQHFFVNFNEFIWDEKLAEYCSQFHTLRVRIFSIQDNLFAQPIIVRLLSHFHSIRIRELHTGCCILFADDLHSQKKSWRNSSNLQTHRKKFDEKTLWRKKQNWMAERYWNWPYSCSMILMWAHRRSCVQKNLQSILCARSIKRGLAMILFSMNRNRRTKIMS